MIILDNVKYYNTKELSEMPSLHIKTIQKMIREGRLKGNKIGKNYHVSEDNLKLYLNGEKE